MTCLCPSFPLPLPILTLPPSPGVQSILEQFNPALENLVYLGNNYLRAFHGECLATAPLPATPSTQILHTPHQVAIHHFSATPSPPVLPTEGHEPPRGGQARGTPGAECYQPRPAFRFFRVSLSPHHSLHLPPHTCTHPLPALPLTCSTPTSTPAPSPYLPHTCAIPSPAPALPLRLCPLHPAPYLRPPYTCTLPSPAPPLLLYLHFPLTYPTPPLHLHPPHPYTCAHPIPAPYPSLWAHTDARTPTQEKPHKSPKQRQALPHSENPSHAAPLSLPVPPHTCHQGPTSLSHAPPRSHGGPCILWWKEGSPEGWAAGGGTRAGPLFLPHSPVRGG